MMKGRIINLLLLSAAFVFVFISCNKNKETIYTSLDDMVKEAEANVVKIDPSELKLLIDEEEIFQIVDCREAEDYIAGHIPHAINVPRGTLEFSAKVSNRRLKTLVFSYGNGSGILAFESLKKLKYFDLYLIDGNWDKWIEKYPDLIEEGAGKAAPAAAPDDSGGGCGG